MTQSTAIGLNPDYAKAWSNKGAALLDLGQFQEALECSNRAIGLKPDYADAWGNKGIALCGLSNSLRSGGRACRMVDPILTTPMERTIPRKRGTGAIYDTDEFVFSKVAGSAGDFNGDGVFDVFFAGRGGLFEGAMVILYGGSTMFPGRIAHLEESLLRGVGGLLIAGRSILGGQSNFWATVPGATSRRRCDDALSDPSPQPSPGFTRSSTSSLS